MTKGPADSSLSPEAVGRAMVRAVPWILAVILTGLLIRAFPLAEALV